MDSTSRMRSSSGRWSSIPKRRLERVVKAAGAASQTASAEAPLARSKSKAAIQRLASIVRNGKDSDAIRACEALLDRGFGRPPPQHALQGPDGAGASVKFEFINYLDKEERDQRHRGELASGAAVGAGSQLDALRRSALVSGGGSSLNTEPSLPGPSSIPR